jgi:hypothetical protein
VTDYAAYFLSSKSSVVYLETLEISHPSFSQTYWIVRNAIGGITATLETAVAQAFVYYPLRIRPVGASDDLDQVLRVDLGDLGEIIPKEIDAITAAGTMGIKPTVKYRAWRSDDLTEPLVGPLVLEIADLSSNREGSSFEASAPKFNINRTGELYRLERFPMLRGLL